MTRVMFWNIEQFSINKIQHPLAAVGGGGARARRAEDRLTLIMRMVQQADPDILAIVELRTGVAMLGSLVSANGLPTSVKLLRELQKPPALDWRLVPPVRTSWREGVAVYYRSSRLIFSGPFRWGGGPHGLAGKPGVGILGTPGAPYALGGVGWGLGPAIIGENAVPGGSRYNPNIAEQVCAAQTTDWHTFPGGAAREPFPERQPYFTTFAEINAAKEFVRDVALCSIHAPANANAPAYMEELAECEEIVGAPALNEVRIVAGDFNINLLDALGNIEAPYQELVALGFELGLKPPAPPIPFSPTSPGYYATHIKPRANSTFWAPNAYPGYGYIGERFGPNLYAIDNIFTCGGVPLNFTILNPVVGSPFTAYAPPDGPTGVRIVNRRGGLPQPGPDLPPPLPPPLAPPQVAPPFHIGDMQTFRGWGNYGQIRSTSDHLAIVMDV